MIDYCHTGHFKSVSGFLWPALVLVRSPLSFQNLKHLPLALDPVPISGWKDNFSSSVHFNGFLFLSMARLVDPSLLPSPHTTNLNILDRKGRSSQNPTINRIYLLCLLLCSG